LVLDPPLLLCDEPTGNLDTANSARVMDVIRGAHRKGTTVLIVTHDESLAMANATRIIRMADGRVAGDEQTGLAAA
jgi:ABC-type ATPase involved in cell division